ncbi:MAG: zinc ribbon domain-containing protein [Coprobacillus sp.]
MYCKKCGKQIEEVNYCPYCGADQTATQTTQNEQENQGYQPINQQPYQQQSYQQQSYQGQSYNDDESHIGFAVLSFFIPIVGLVLYLVWNKEYPKKAKSCLNGLIAGVVLYVVFVCCMISAGIGFASAVEEQYYDWDFNAIVETVPYE